MLALAAAVLSAQPSCDGAGTPCEIQTMTAAAYITSLGRDGAVVGDGDWREPMLVSRRVSRRVLARANGAVPRHRPSLLLPSFFVPG